MISKIFVNLAVKDLEKSMAFFKAIGFAFNPQFSDKTAACMVMSDDIYAMLLTHEKVKQFTNKEIADAHKTTEVLTALAVESKAKVHELVDEAIAAGAKEPRPPQDYGFMFGRSFDDRRRVDTRAPRSRGALARANRGALNSKPPSGNLPSPPKERAHASATLSDVRRPLRGSNRILPQGTWGGSTDAYAFQGKPGTV
jgi:uncharacterized protein